MTVSSRPVRTPSVTMRDVAKRARVSQSTVSRVLSGTSDTIPIGEKTLARVLQAVADLGYHPNLHAGSLRGQKTRMVAIMVADITNPFYHPIIRAVQDIAYDHRYDVMVANWITAQISEQHFVESVIRRPVDGVLVVPYHLGDEDLDDLMKRTGAVVGVVGQHIRHPEVDIAFGDDGTGDRGHDYLAPQREGPHAYRLYRGCPVLLGSAATSGSIPASHAASTAGHPPRLRAVWRLVARKRLWGHAAAAGSAHTADVSLCLQ